MSVPCSVVMTRGTRARTRRRQDLPRQVRGRGVRNRVVRVHDVEPLVARRPARSCSRATADTAARGTADSSASRRGGTTDRAGSRRAANGRVAAQDVDAMPARRERLPEFGRDDAAAADRRVTDDADVHRLHAWWRSPSGLPLSVDRTIGSRTTTPSAQRTPASAPNCASRLSIELPEQRRVQPRVGGADRRAGTGSRGSRAPPLALVVIGHVDDERRRRAVVDEVVADPVRLPRLALRRIAPQAGVERPLRSSTLARGDVIGMAIGPVRHGDDARPMTPDEGDRLRRDEPDPCRCARSGQPQVLAPGRAEHADARLRPSASRSSSVPLLPISPAVRSHRPTRQPSAACRAIVPPRPISMSSGCGPKTSRSTADASRRTRTPRRPASSSPR